MMDSPNDANGAAVTLGAAVKLQGTVTAINLFDNRFNDIEVTITHPLAAQDTIKQPTGADSSVPGLRLKFTVPAGYLVLGV
jgi:hypothetical protein